MPERSIFGYLARQIVDKLISAPINSKDGIHVSMDSPYRRYHLLNILRPSVLRQYYGRNIDNQCHEEYVRRYSYGTGSGSNTLGIDGNKFMTKNFTHEIDTMAKELHTCLKNNRRKFNLQDVDLHDGFNHCTILLYYGGEGLKKESLLPNHCDCTYSTKDGTFLHSANSQVENTPTVVYSVGTKRRLNWCRRRLAKTGSRNIWESDKEWSSHFDIVSDTISTIHPDDENAKTPFVDPVQYQHGNVKVGKNEFSIGFVFRIVDSVGEYSLKSDLHYVDPSNTFKDFSKDYENFNKKKLVFHQYLLSLFKRTVD